MYPYYNDPWQSMVPQPQGYHKPIHPMQQQMMQPQQMMPMLAPPAHHPAPQMQSMQFMPPMHAMPMQHPGHPQFSAPPMMPMMQGPSAVLQAPMPQQTMPAMMQSPSAMLPAPMPQQAMPAVMQAMPQMAAPPLQHAPQPLPLESMEPAHMQQPAPQRAPRQDVDQFIQDDEDDFDQERYDAIKARIRKLRGALR